MVLGLSGNLYLAAAVVLDGVFVPLGIAIAVRRDERGAVRLFLGSLAYVPLLLLLMVWIG